MFPLDPDNVVLPGKSNSGSHEKGVVRYMLQVHMMQFQERQPIAIDARQ